VVVGCVMLGYDPSMTLRALIHSAEDGGYWAEVPALPGCVSQGETIDELRSNIREAIEGWLLAANDAEKVQATDQIIEVAV
jgi:predicted RNase H-like HicB family nuclease